MSPRVEAVSKAMFDADRPPDSDHIWRNSRIIRQRYIRMAKAAIAANTDDTKADALEEAADEMELVIADGDMAEQAAPVEGEVGRHIVVDRRDALYEEPHTWLRDRADALRQKEKP